MIILDTSVLLYDRSSIYSFPGKEVILPLDVLDELDRAKSKIGIVGENARFINRYLDELRTHGNLNQGILIPDGDSQTIKVMMTRSEDVPSGLDVSSVDNRIIGLANRLITQEGKHQTEIVTKDINFRVKCDALGIIAVDYYKDSLDEDSQLYTGICTRKVSDDIIDEVHHNGSISIDKFRKIFPNEFVILKSDTDAKKSALTICYNDELRVIKSSTGMNAKVPVSPKNKEQRFALHLLLSKEIPLVTMTGIAGSGKTFLSLMAGLSELYNNRYDRIVITRPIQPVGKDLGYLPGDLNEKMAPWLSPILDNFRDGLKDVDHTWFKMMQDKREIEVAPLPYIRGRTFNDSYIIVDEAQNATIHELKTLITRVGSGSKIVLMGDVDQVDTPYIDTMSNGLSIIADKFRSSPLSGHVQLPKGERSPLASLASKVL